MYQENQTVLDEEIPDEPASFDNRLVILKRPDKYGLYEEDEDEREARAEYIHKQALHRFYGPFLDTLDKEADVKLRVIRNKDGTRDIRVKIGARKRRQTSFNLRVMMSQGSAEEGDSNAFCSRDFLDSLDEFDKLAWAIGQTKRKLDWLCIDWDVLTRMPADRRELLKKRILALHDKIVGMSNARARREAARRDRFLSGQSDERRRACYEKPVQGPVAEPELEESDEPVVLSAEEQAYLDLVPTYEEVFGLVSKPERE